MGRIILDVYQEAIKAKEGIHIDDSAIFMGYKISKREDESITISETGRRYHGSGYKLAPEEYIKVFLEKGWINGAKHLYLSKYQSMSEHTDERISNFAKSKLNKYYERFSKVK